MQLVTLFVSIFGVVLASSKIYESSNLSFQLSKLSTASESDENSNSLAKAPPGTPFSATMRRRSSSYHAEKLANGSYKHSFTVFSPNDLHTSPITERNFFNNFLADTSSRAQLITGALSDEDNGSDASDSDESSEALMFDMEEYDEETEAEETLKRAEKETKRALKKAEIEAKRTKRTQKAIEKAEKEALKKGAEESEAENYN